LEWRNMEKKGGRIKKVGSLNLWAIRTVAVLPFSSKPQQL